VSVRDALHRFKNVGRSGDGWTAQCPSHGDAHNSLSIGEGDDGRLLLKCHANAGCTYESISRAAGIEKQSSQRIITSYDYRDEKGALLYQALRYDPKGFSQRRPEGNGWAYKLNGVRRVPYRLLDIIGAGAGALVFVVEGEKDAGRLAGFGFVATTNAGGAGEVLKSLCKW
jgi:putative DNA primase/helicase